MSTLAQVIKRARESKGWSQEELAERLGVSKGWVGQVETGRIDRPRPQYLALLEQHLGVSRDELARGMNMIGPAATGDVLEEIRRIRQIDDPKDRAQALRSLPPEVYEVIEWLALDMVRLTFQQAQAVKRR
jgi:transcriptional regulator with XRE-family HTH domain